MKQCHTLNLPSLALVCDRIGTLDHDAAILVNAVFKDTGFTADENLTNVVDKNKIRRERQKMRKQTVQESSSKLPLIEALYFDGKDTIIAMGEEGIKRCEKIVEEHYVLVKEPGIITLFLYR